jgi:phenylpyruvate tautomerase PptA (4-oxalocrotonate tautomerase family)
MTDALIAGQAILPVRKISKSQSALCLAAAPKSGTRADSLERKAEITMPLYHITTPEGSLSSEAKAALAAEITEFHSQMSGLAEAYTKIVFDSFLPGDGFIGREAGPAMILTVKVRAGRPADYRKKLLFGLKSILQRATGAADVQMLLALEETPASNAIEMGELMPEIGA